ncbi:CA14 [Symbiodinium natans]|uniref:CA14 protein n=1 Tax=Symbiodinium natans TaxID=878477 RepID=A0A812I9D6_9DINO|nr:CA14 [Symbiodinium natans]
MFLDGMMSQIGISTQGSLDALRRQLGPGVDPLYDYSAKQDSHRPRHVEKKDQEGTKESTMIEQLRRTLREVVGINTTAEEQDAQQAEEDDEVEAKVPAGQLRALREQKRPMSSFVSTSREYMNALAIENRFRAPPPGSYRPMTHLCAPRVKTPVFTNREPTHSRKRMVMEREVRKLQSAGKPCEHLLQGVTSVELLDEPPERMRRAVTTPNLERYPPRPDLLKSAGINFNDSTFTDGVLDGDCSTSMILRTPEWDFAKLSASRHKDPETYFQPGQYKPNLDAVRPKLETKNIPFHKLPARKPLKESVGRFEVDGREGDHLPDRSLARSCPLLGTRPRLHSPDLSKYSDRPSIIGRKKPWHDVNDPEADRIVWDHEMSFNIMDAEKARWKSRGPPEDFNRSLTRQQHLRSMRTYGQDVSLTRAKENLNGPVSVELQSDIDSSPILKPRLWSPRFDYMATREPEYKYAESPARLKEKRGAKFKRELRPGESLTDIQCLSPLAGAIGELRSSRCYEAMGDSLEA